MFRNDRKTIYINSAPAYRDVGGTSEDFTITDTGDTLTNLPKTVKLVNACIPFTWFNVYQGTQSNNHFQFEDGASTQYTFDIAPGNYNGTTLAAALQAALNDTASPDTFTVTFAGTLCLYPFRQSHITLHVFQTLKIKEIRHFVK